MTSDKYGLDRSFVEDSRNAKLLLRQLFYCNGRTLSFLESKLVQCTQDNSMIARRGPLRIVLFNNEECLQMKQTGLNMTGFVSFGYSDLEL